MPSTMKGPAIFLAQFAGDAAPFNSLPSIAKWAAGLGYKGIQIPTWDARLFDLDKAAGSKTYCDEVKGICKDAGVEITELSTHLQGQLVAVQPAYDTSFDAFAPAQYPNNPKARQKWAAPTWLKHPNIELRVPKKEGDLATLRKVHHKLMVIDDRIVVAGSFNYTQPANDYNDENLFVLGSPHSEASGVDVEPDPCRALSLHVRAELDRIFDGSKVFVPS